MQATGILFKVVTPNGIQYSFQAVGLMPTGIILQMVGLLPSTNWYFIPSGNVDWCKNPSGTAHGILFQVVTSSGTLFPDFNCADGITFLVKNSILQILATITEYVVVLPIIKTNPLNIRRLITQQCN